MNILKYTVCLTVLCFLPLISLAAVQKKHPPMKAGQECSECHAVQDQNLQRGKHGVTNVMCVICHSFPGDTFIAKPDIYRCRGCHAEQVIDVEKKLPSQSRNCSLCHDPHSTLIRFHKTRG